jgi:L-Ala-D/L-Glu epimerase
MKIKNISCTSLDIPLKTPFVFRTKSIEKMSYVQVMLHCEKDIIGYGEAVPQWVTQETEASIRDFLDMDHLQEYFDLPIKNIPIWNLDDIRNICSILNTKDQKNPAAVAGFEQALLDAFCKTNKISIYTLLDIEKIPVPYSLTISMYNTQETIRQFRNNIKYPYKYIRFKVGKKDSFDREGYGRDIEVIEKAKSIIDKDGLHIKLIADANEGFENTEEAVAFCRETQNALEWLEQPVSKQIRRAFKEVSEGSNLALMADESLHNLADAEKLIAEGGVQYFNIKLMKCGGLFEAIKIFDLAKKNKIQCQIGSMIESSYGALMGILFYQSRPSICTTDLYAFDILKSQYAGKLRLENAYIYMEENE